MKVCARAWLLSRGRTRKGVRDNILGANFERSLWIVRCSREVKSRRVALVF
jgi:hypothetical protein